MTLHITIDRDLGTDIVREEGGTALGLLKKLEIGAERRYAEVLDLGPGDDFNTAMDTRHALIRHGFIVRLVEPEDL